MENLLQTDSEVNSNTETLSKEDINDKKILMKIANYIDTTCCSQLSVIVEEYYNEEFQAIKIDHDLNEKRRDFFRKALLESLEEERKAKLRTSIISLLLKEVDWFFDEIEDNLKKYPNLTYKSAEMMIEYAKYVSNAVYLGRSPNDVFKLPFDKICEIANYEENERQEELEQFVLENNVGIRNLKRIVQIINKDNSITFDVALQQAEKEAKEKREDIKKGGPLERKYKTLLMKYRRTLKAYDDFVGKYLDVERSQKKYKRRFEKNSKKINNLEKTIDNIKKFLNSKGIDFKEFENAYPQIL